LDLPAGVRSFNYGQDMAIFRTKTHWFLFLMMLVVLFAMPMFLANYWLSVANLIMITIIAATGLNILTGYCGQLSIGHAGFMAVGAYTSAILTRTFDLPFPVGFLCAGIMAGLVGMLFGISSLRVKGFYLAISSLAAQFIIIWVIGHWDSVTGGTNGLPVSPAKIAGLALSSQSDKFYLILLVTIMAIFVAKNLSRTRTGRAFVAIRDNDLAAEVMGISPFRYKLLAFFIGCFFAGIAGSLFAHWTGYINPESFPFTNSILYVGMIIIGGLGTTIGPIFGVIFIQLLNVLVTHISPALRAAFPSLSSGFVVGIAPMLFGLAIILFLIFEPRGLAHRWQLFKASYRLWPFSY
jgi:branched-chain amino acid transport system permease protein